MNFTLADIRSDVLHIYEKGRRTKKASGYHVYLRNAYQSWPDLSEEGKMSLIRPALRRTLIERLRTSGILGSDFDEITDDPFSLAPFTSSDFKGDMREVVSFHWNRSSDERKEAWRQRSERIREAFPPTGEFAILPTMLFRTGESSDSVLQRFLAKDYVQARLQFERKYKKYENAKTIYNKIEHLYFDIKINHKFYFYEHLPCSVMESLFGHDFEKFYTHERVSDAQNKKSATFHIFSQQRTAEILSISDLKFGEYTSYNKIEINSYLCSYAIIAPVSSARRGNIKCYGWDQYGDHPNQIMILHFNNFDDTGFLQASFNFPTLEKSVTICDGKEKTSYNYIFTNRRSLCSQYEILSICPVAFQINNEKLTLKLIASRACKEAGLDSFSKKLSS